MIPTIRASQLAEAAGLSMTSARRALIWLTQQGLIQAQTSDGTPIGQPLPNDQAYAYDIGAVQNLYMEFVPMPNYKGGTHELHRQCPCKRDTEPCHCADTCICWCCVHDDTDPYQLYVQYAGFEQNQGHIPSTFAHWLSLNPGLARKATATATPTTCEVCDGKENVEQRYVNMPGTFVGTMNVCATCRMEGNR